MQACVESLKFERHGYPTELVVIATEQTRPSIAPISISELCRHVEMLTGINEGRHRPEEAEGFPQL